MNTAYRVQMTESEAGWGQRPDGFIYSASKEALQRKLKQVADTAEYDCYSFPSSDIHIVPVTTQFGEFLKNQVENYTHWVFKKHDCDLS